MLAKEVWIVYNSHAWKIKGVVILFSLLKPKKCALALLGSGILAFGLYNIHALSGVTEGGVLGMTLFLHHWIGLSPALSGLVLNALCYWLGWKLLGREFIAYSIVAGGGFSNSIPSGPSWRGVLCWPRCWAPCL